MCICYQMYLIYLVKLCFLLYFIYVITRQTMVTVGIISLSVNLLISLFGGKNIDYMPTFNLIIILVYRPPSIPLSDFDDIITKTTREFILTLPTPQPNIILLGDFNMPEVIWDSPHAYNPSSELLINLAILLLLNQNVSTPIRKSIVLDLIFCSYELIKGVDVSECFSSSDHCLIKTETYIPVDPIIIQAKCINPPMTSIEKFDFNRSDWINLSQSFKFTNRILKLDQVSPDEFLPVAINILISKCSIHVLLKHPKEARNSIFQKERRVLMRKRTKLSRII